jgi:hypothetical protein
LPPAHPDLLWLPLGEGYSFSAYAKLCSHPGPLGDRVSCCFLRHLVYLLLTCCLLATSLSTKIQFFCLPLCSLTQ